MIVLNQKQKRMWLILGAMTILLLAIVAIVTAIRLQQIGTEPVAPSVPKSKPKAADSAKTWMIAAESQLSPTSTVMITSTAAPVQELLAQGPTAIPTVAQIELPEVGGVLPTIGAAVAGLGIILLGLLLLL